MQGCAGETCCSRWREVGRAFSEGRKDEAAQEAARAVAAGENVGCRIGARVLEMMAREGYGPHAKPVDFSPEGP